MEEINFLVQDSAAEPYKASFIKDGYSLTAFCTCPAGVNGRACKHRISILNGSGKGIVSENVEDVQKVKTWLPGSEVEEALSAVRKAELLAAAGKKDLSAAKKNLSSEDVENVQKVKTWLPGSAIKEAQFAFAKAELLAAAGEKNFSAAKKKLSRVMHG